MNRNFNIKRRFKYYLLWGGIYFLTSTLLLLVSVLTQVFSLYVSAAVYLPVIILSSFSFVILFQDKWWVGFSQGIGVFVFTLFLILMAWGEITG